MTRSEPGGDPATSGAIAAARPVLAASIAVFRDARVLVARRTRDPLRGCFSLPGGRVEGGETLAAAALRELREEVAVEATLLGFNRHVEHIERAADGRVTAHFVIASFVGRWSAGEGTPSDEADLVRWVALDDLYTMPTTAGLRDTVVAAWDLYRNG